MLKRNMERLSVVCFLMFIAFAIWCTIISRPEIEREYKIEVFWALKSLFSGMRKGRDETIFYLKNIVFFIPFGVFFPWKEKGIRGVLVSAVFFSSFIEVTQLVTARGLCEIDDVVANTIGAGLGVCIRYSLNRINPTRVVNAAKQFFKSKKEVESKWPKRNIK